jgi:hypothetical protein
MAGEIVAWQDTLRGAPGLPITMSTCHRNHRMIATPLCKEVIDLRSPGRIDYGFDIAKNASPDVPFLPLFDPTVAKPFNEP